MNVWVLGASYHAHDESCNMGYSGSEPHCTIEEPTKMELLLLLKKVTEVSFN